LNIVNNKALHCLYKIKHKERNRRIIRPEETYARTSLERYLSGKPGKFKILDNYKDPPDFYVLHNRKLILLEVTCAYSALLENGELKSRITFSESLSHLTAKLNYELGSRFSPHRTLSLSIYGPIKEYSDFKKEIRAKISSITEDKDLLNIICTDWTDIDINGVLIKAILVGTSPEHPRIWGMVGIEAKKAIADINLHTCLILQDRIKDKEAKTKLTDGRIWYGEKWLAIINQYPLANTDNYLRAIEEIDINHTFSQIFLIEGDYKVTSLFSITTSDRKAVAPNSRRTYN